MRPRDTSAEAHDFQLRGYRRMTLPEKAELIAQMSEAARAVAREGIRQRHPDYAEPDVDRALVTLIYGRETARRLWPDEEPRLP